MTLAPGSSVGPYLIVERIGEGAMGEVYRARDERLGRLVAVKILPPAFASDRARQQRFEQEARAAGSIDHPNIVAVHDLGTHEGAPYLVTELLEGHTLRTLLIKGAMPIERVLSLARQLVAGIEAAHQKGVIHRDIKPENLFVTSSDQLKILDFGLAKLAEAPGDQSMASSPTIEQQTTPGTVLGTVGYMAPEQVRGQPATAQSDLFSIGAVLYELVAGQRAFDAGSSIETMNAILKEEPRALAELAASVPREFVRIIERCIEKDPALRPPSAAILRQLLERVPLERSAGSFDAATTTRGQRPAPARSTASGLVVGLAVAFVSTATVLGYTTWRIRAPAPLPTFRQVTFERGTVYTARFTPDGLGLVYSAAWSGRPKELFALSFEAGDARSLGQRNTDVAGISVGQELALISRTNNAFGPGMLSRMPMAGGSKRDLLDGVEWADWRGDGVDAAVVRDLGLKRQLEYPIGTPIFESSGDLTYAHVSPSGQQVAVLVHSRMQLDEGDLLILDRQGRQVARSSGWASIEGVGWRPDGKVVWFTASRAGIALSLWSLSLSGELQRVLNVPGRLVLHDVARDGRIVAERNTFRRHITGRFGEGAEVDLSWLDFTALADVSSDGRSILFGEDGEAAQRRSRVYYRKDWQSPPVRLGDGVPLAFSPDARDVVAFVDGPARLRILPTGAGASREVPLQPLERVSWAQWLPDGQSFVVYGNEPGMPERIYRIDVGQPPRPVGEAGLRPRGRALSPDGTQLALLSAGGVQLLPLDGGPARTLPGTAAHELPLGWSDGGRALWVRDMGTEVTQANILRVSIDGKQRTPWRVLVPTELAGRLWINSVQLAGDGSWYVYGSESLLSDLYVIEGVR